MTRLYPLFADLAGREVLVVGGGPVAERKTAALLAAGARVTVGAPELTAMLQRWVGEGRVRHRQGGYEGRWLAAAWLVVAATGDRGLNARVAADATRRRLFVNVVDDAELSSFQIPAVIDRSPLLVALSTGGAAPALARRLREHIESLLDPSLGPLLRLAARFRHGIRSRFADIGERRRFYDWLWEGPVLRSLRAGRSGDAARALLAALNTPRQPATQGSVALVGAGPGDPDLLTLRALRALNEADVILHDALVSQEILELARRDALRIAVGKRGGREHTSQDLIHALMLGHARTGRRVVRLKGGDPFVFGRGGEELQFLHAHGISCEVVPGITAALACAAYAGVPLTHRDHARSLRLVTAHCRDSLDAVDWAGCASPHETLVVYMGLGQLPRLTQRLLEAGRDPATPFALVENGSLPSQRTLTGRLADLPALAAHHGIAAPALLILGETAALASTLGWHGSFLPAAHAGVREVVPG